MSASREALLNRFRATLQGRVKDLRALLEVLEFMPNDAEARRRVLGEVHTLKGEARMLGLLDMADLAHKIEEFLKLDEAEAQFSTLLRAADVLWEVLEPGVSSEVAAQQLADVSKQLVANDVQADESAAGELNPAGEREPRSIPPPGVELFDDGAVAPSFAVGPETESKDGREPGSGPRPKQARTIQVDAEKIDDACERVAELGVELARLRSLTEQLLERIDDQVQHQALQESFATCRTALDTCADAVWGLRLSSIEPILQDLMQHARSLAAQQSKQLRTEVHATGVLLERDVVEQIWDSLLHLVRNSIDHGIQNAEDREGKGPSTLRIEAQWSGPNVVIAIEDNGRGIDIEALREAAVAKNVLSPAEAQAASKRALLQLIFMHGFSTRHEVGELSGRGVGLDVVKSKVESLGGRVQVRTELGQGTRFELTVPFAITKERVLVLQVGDSLLGVPSRAAVALLARRDLPAVDAERPDLLKYEEEFIPLRSLAKCLRIEETEVEQRAVILELSGQRFGAKVRSVIGEHSLIRHPAPAWLSKTNGVGSSALLDDGRLVLLLDFSFLQRALGADSYSRPSLVPGLEKRARQRVLVVDDSPVITEMMYELLSSVGLQVVIATNGSQALELVEAEAPDLVVSDVEMPLMDGFQLLAEIRRRSERLPVVMLTTRGSIEDRRRASSLGANAFVLKTDFRSDALLDVVRRFVRLAS